MFEFAISQNKKRPPSKRFFASSTLSCILHVVAVILLIEYPQLLSPGLNRWFRQPSLLSKIFSQEFDQQSQKSDWRTVTFVGKSRPGKLVEPSAATLRAYMYNWNKPENAFPPVRVRLGNENQGTPAETSVPKTQPVMGTQEPKPSGAAGAEKAAAAPAAVPAQTGGEEGAQVAASGAGAGKSTVYLPAPQPGGEARVKKAPESSPNVAPTSIPLGISPPPSSAATTTPKPAGQAPAKAGAKTFEDEQKAIHTEGNGLFGTMGFPLGEYADVIIERVKGNWLIPSNLRNSQGHTTVIFYIERDGGYSNLHIVAPSGSNSLDLAALNAVIESKPFPPLPKGFPADRVGAKFVFSYNERQ